MTLPRPQILPPSIPTVSLANLALLVAFYFILTSGYDIDPTPVRLPVTDHAIRIEPSEACLVLSRRVSAAGSEVLEYSFSDGTSPSRDLSGADALWHEASRVVDRDADAPFVVKADGSVRWAVVDDAVGCCRRGARRRSIPTRSCVHRSMRFLRQGNPNPLLPPFREGEEFSVHPPLRKGEGIPVSPPLGKGDTGGSSAVRRL